MLISLTEYAKRHGKSPVSVRQKAERGGFRTARKIGRNWIIDEEEEYEDRRVKADKKDKKLSEQMSQMSYMIP